MLLILDNSVDPDNADVHFLTKNALPDVGRAPSRHCPDTDKGS